MYAVIKTGGKQYRVAMNDVIVVEKLAADPGQTVEFDQVLMMDGAGGLAVGAPLVEGARVAATVLDQTRGDKVIIFKKKRRKNYRRLRGHRQDLTVLRVIEILAKGEKARAAATPAPKPEPKEAAPKAEPAEAAPVEAAPEAPVESPAQPEPAAEAAEPARAAEKKPAAKKATEKKPAAKKPAAKKPAKKAAAKKAPAKKAPAKKAPAKKKAAKKKPS